jgi:hypothetical protein
MRRPVLGLALVIVSQPVGAQLAPPPTWKWVTDRPATNMSTSDKLPDSAFTFVQMPPGWHVTMGPGGVLYEPRYFAEGAYSLQSEIFHFPNSTNSEYGFAVGVREPGAPSARYVAFVLRGDGSVSAWERSADGTRSLAEWRRAEAVIPNDGKDVIRNVVKLTVTGKEAVLRANGLEVLTIPLEGLSLDGQFGFRVGSGVNLHVTTLDVTQRLAPPRRSGG